MLLCECDVVDDEHDDGSVRKLFHVAIHKNAWIFVFFLTLDFLI